MPERLEREKIVVLAEEVAGGLERPSAREPRQCTELLPLSLGQLVVAPLNRRTKRLMPRQHGAARSGEKPEAIVQPRADVLDREQFRPGRGELDRERYSIQAPADLHHP